MSDLLLQDVKNYLDITWIDERTDKKLTLMIEDGIRDLNQKSGTVNNYTIAGRARTLLFNRVLYDLNKALDDFYINYKSEIIAFINEAKVKKYVSKKISAGDI